MKNKLMLAAALALGIAPVPLTSLSIAAHADTGQCLDSDARLMAMMNANQPPQSANTIVMLTNLMYVLDQVLMVMDRDCRGQPDYAQVRAEYANIRQQTYTTCQQLASSQSVCVPKPYARAY